MFFIRHVNTWDTDSFKYDGWTHRDLALRYFGHDYLESVASQCYSLLWLAAHEDPGDPILAQCISDTPGPAAKRLCGSWVAISEMLGFHSAERVHVLEYIEAVGTYDVTQGNFHFPPGHDLVVRISDALCTLNGTQIRIVFELLLSGLGVYAGTPLVGFLGVFVSGFTHSNMVNLQHSTLLMMSLLAKQHVEVRASYRKFLLQTLADMERVQLVQWTGYMKTCAVIIACNREVHGLCGVTINEMSDCLDFACAYYRGDGFRSDERRRCIFWTVVEVVIFVRIEDEEGQYEEDIMQRWSLALDRFADVLINVLSILSGENSEQRVAGSDIGINWDLFLWGVAVHRWGNPKRSDDISKCVLNARRRGFFSEATDLAFINLGIEWGARWDDVYEHFGFPPIPRSGEGASPPSNPRPSSMNVQPTTNLVASASELDTAPTATKGLGSIHIHVIMHTVVEAVCWLIERTGTV
ncbi:hypothetical protein PUNSTDRAFT_134816 [Punctularia strigosozonata HHB-11173 SS5]|uniref:uncharacterized protein n=1 Tax=Punctularia strigosozonata (strain HHB-11173) TaxID=741275 RepID=UPI0004417D85|nr:uncharacterized protein PUNSTDRAFT_134816 [Punctularia strigosozonata HHB-11173 SS5]EIN08434.1 hypothetical protein PUNSTDRAFT_134816 [Punctularia strigosozonata HHB-11173 SS5]